MADRVPRSDDEQNQINKSERDKFYKSTRWKKTSKFHLARNPLCVECERAGFVVAGAVADHVVPRLETDPSSWFSLGNLQTLCHRCHNIKTARER